MKPTSRVHDHRQVVREHRDAGQGQGARRCGSPTCACPTCCTAASCIPKTLGSTLVSAGDAEQDAVPERAGRRQGQPGRRGRADRVGSDRRRAADRGRHEVDRVEGPARPRRSCTSGCASKADWKSTPVAKSDKSRGDVAPALASAAKTLTASYELPFMKHAPIGPTIAVGDVQARRHGVHPHAQPEPAGAARTDRHDARHAGRQRGGPHLRGPGPLRPLERRQRRRRRRGGDPVEGGRPAGARAVDAPRRPAVVHAVAARALRHPIGWDASGKITALPGRSLHAGDAGRPAGRGAASPGCRRRRRRTSRRGRLDRLDGQRHLGSVGLRPGPERRRVGVRHVPARTEGVAAGHRPARPQHADAGTAAAELPARAGDQRGGGAGRHRRDRVPPQADQRRAADRRAEGGARGVGLADPPVAEPESRRHRRRRR